MKDYLVDRLAARVKELGLEDDYFLSSAEKNKKLLLEIARKGEERLNAKCSLGMALCRYTNPKKDSCYDPEFDKKIRRLRPDWFVNQSDRANDKKQEILKRAKRGENRPSGRGHPLGVVLRNYTSPNNVCYDPEFDKEIRKLAPHWFVSSATENKKQLLEMARRGDERPISGGKNKHFLGQALLCYTNSKNGSYDPEFDKKIRKFAPHWFIDTAVENKKQLLEMAQRGEPKPAQRTHPLGTAFSSYTYKGPCYDPVFYQDLLKIRPDWFENKCDKKKNELLEMAKRKESRPIAGKHPLGCMLTKYTNDGNSAYDKEFDLKIRQLAPHWFIDTATENKRRLLEMARNGDPKPIVRKHRLGYLLSNYCRKDEKFRNCIQKIAPHWFIDTAAENKRQLLEMARNGEPRPIYGKHPLGQALCSYIGSSCFDADFNKIIRQLAPDWFKKGE